VAGPPLTEIGAVNSINWARLVAQVVCYFSSYFQVTEEETTEVDFTVPSGNFGNICAGHVAPMMGLPISRLVIATNENDVLDEFFLTGVYRVRDRANTYETSSPSMDISKASNLERFVFDLLGRDASRTKSLFDDQHRERGSFDLTGDPAFVDVATRFSLRSGKSTHADRLGTIRDTWHRFNALIDPHTADGVKVAQALRSGDADDRARDGAVKFAGTMREALGRAPDRSQRFDGIEDLPRRFKILPADAQTV
jgi:threonine synthase